MEASKEAISVRVSRLNEQLLGRSDALKKNDFKTQMDREGLLDALTVLYDECNTDTLKRTDKFIAGFVDKYRGTISEFKRLRVNISDFEVKNVIGRGHFGIVHVVREKQTGDVYAMKTLRKSDSLNQQCASYEEERDIMATTKSPWLTSLQYAFQDTGHLYLVMEFHPGGDLYGLLDRQGGVLQEYAAVFYLSELVEAIKALHTMGYVHRDVKPDNVLLDRCGHLKLADFGSAAKISTKGTVSDRDVISIGTPDYIAPEVLQSIDKTKNKNVTYGIACDYWSLGVLAYEITIGTTPFSSPTTTATYNKIINYHTNLKFPSDSDLSGEYIRFIKGLLTDQNERLTHKQIIDHRLFKETDWTNLREQVPPFVPKVSGVDDTSNFLEVEIKKPAPSIDNFKSKTQFSGRNLPFIGFTYTSYTDLGCAENLNVTVLKRSEEEMLQNRKKEVESLQKMLAKAESSNKEYEALEMKYEDAVRKLEGVECVRDKLEKDLSAAIADTGALKRTLDLERRERKELENKALDLIKNAKLKWEAQEKTRIEQLNEQVEQQNNRITELCTANNELTSRLERSQKLQEQTQNELDRLRSLHQEHKDSLAKARALSRRSIVGVENRLEKISSEAQNQIQDLQTKLSSNIEDRKQLEQQLELYRKRERVLEEQIKLSNDQIESYKRQLESINDRCAQLENESSTYKANVQEMDLLRDELLKCQNELTKLVNDNKCQRLEDALKREKDDIKNLKKQLKDMRMSVNESIMSQETLTQERESKMEKDIQKLQEKLSTVTEEKETLKRRLQEAMEKDTINKIKVRNLEELLSRLESGVTKLESSSTQEQFLEAQVKRLEEQIKELHEKSALDKQELRTANTNLWRKEKELSNAELDKRIVERELKAAEEKINILNEEINELNNNMQSIGKEHDEVLSEIKNQNLTLNTNVGELKGMMRDMEDKFKDYKDKYELEQKVVVQKKNELKNALENIERLNNDMKNEIKERKNLEKQIDEIREDNIRLHYTRDMSKRDEDEAKRETELYKRELENTQLNINVLKEACVLLENQLEEYERLISTHEEKESKLEETMSQLSDDVSIFRIDLQETRQQMNEEKSYRLLAETQCKRLQEDVDLLRKECNSYKQQVLDYKELSAQLSEDLNASEERNGELDYSLKQLERQFDGLKSECIAIKEESAKRLTHIHQIRESNYKLNQEILEAKDDHAALLAKIASLEITLNEQSNYYKQREMKSDATVQQQTKLIDFLQSKIEEGKKKKTFSDKLFGTSKKENIPPSLALNYRELETMLMKERESNRSLKEEVTKLKAATLPTDRVEIKKMTPPNSPKTKLAMEQLVRSPASQNNSKTQRKSSTQRMHHNIPHRFESKICIKSAKCSYCSEPIQLGRTMSFCKECSLPTHNRCSIKLPRTCGLPGEYAKHFTKTLSNTEVDKPKESTPNYGLQNWIKIPISGKKGWERKYARLEHTKLCIYEHEPVNNFHPMLSLQLCPDEGLCTLTSDVSSSECENVVGTDLPFIIKLNVGPHTTCWPDNTQLIMFLSMDDKEKWTTVLGDLFKIKYPDVTKPVGNVITRLVNQENPTCVQEIVKDTLIIGCEDGLYSAVKDQPLVRIEGVIQIHQIMFIKPINAVLMIIEDERLLVKVELKQLESLSQRPQFTNPQLGFKPAVVNASKGYHIFQASDFVKKHILCAATSKQLFILKYDFETTNFVPLRILDTAEPCSCILFNEHSVIVGANKYFEIDLKTFAADEFLDASDHRLTQAYNCHKMGSFPVSIIRVNHQPIEYLLCFNEFGCFVDEYGRRTRENDIKWSHLPLAFAYCNPFLFVIHFAAVELVRILPDDVNDDSLENWVCPDSVRLDYSKPKFLGSNKRGIYIYYKNDVVFLSAKEIVGEVDLSDESESENESEFSFSSSQLQSLDGLDENEVVEKRVHFSTHTDL